MDGFIKDPELLHDYLTPIIASATIMFCEGRNE